MTKIIDKKLFVEATQKKKKLKKNALEPVDKNLEAKIDPKFKTELCKSWIETKFCVYGNKCRFAHGKDEIFNKQVNKTKYKQKDCMSFFQHGFCNYGSRCHFKHDERKLSEIKIPYFSFMYLSNNYLLKLYGKSEKEVTKRLQVFKNLPSSASKKSYNNDFYINSCNSLSSRSINNNNVNSSNEIELTPRLLFCFY